MLLRPVFGCTNSSVRRTSSTRSPQTSRAISITSFSWKLEDDGAGAAGGIGVPDGVVGAEDGVGDVVDELPPASG